MSIILLYLCIFVSCWLFHSTNITFQINCIFPVCSLAPIICGHVLLDKVVFSFVNQIEVIWHVHVKEEICTPSKPKQD